jgi:NitT/TauT family transport system ATP-binding protein
MNALAQFAGPSSATSGAAVLKADNVGVAFGSGKQYVEAIRNVSFELQQGETLAIVGPSGCGKSTLFNAIAGLLKPTRGHVEVAGRRVDDAAGHVGYMLQKDLLLPWRSVLDNVMLGLEVRGGAKARSREVAMKLIKAYGLAGFENAKPATLSGGMRQRVSFLRTMLAGKPVLALDEPFAALDAITRAEMQGWLGRVLGTEPRTVVLVTHDVEEAVVLGDRVVVMSARPGHAVAEIPVALPRPRRRTDPELTGLRERVYLALGMPQ